MKVILAGYNLDSEVIEALKGTSPPRADVTPETLSAAYARISRDPRPVYELRRAAREEVERARRSNQIIIFKMGHHLLIAGAFCSERTFASSIISAGSGKTSRPSGRFEDCARPCLVKRRRSFR